MHLGIPDTETQSAVNGVAPGYKRASEEDLWQSNESALVFTRPQRRAKVSGKVRIGRAGRQLYATGKGKGLRPGEHRGL